MRTVAKMPQEIFFATVGSQFELKSKEHYRLDYKKNYAAAGKLIRRLF